MDTAWFKARKRELKVSDERIAETIGRDRTTVTKVINGDVRFDLSYVDAFAAILKVPTSEILARVGVTIDEKEAAPAMPVSPAVGLAADQPVARSIGAGEIVEITRLDLSLPMGPGATVDDYVEHEPLVFDAAYVRSFTRTPPYRLRLAAGAGDSMFPTLVPNDLVWIDTTQNQLLHADRIYAASINGGAAIKRLRPVAGGARILVISDNKMIEPYEVEASEVVIWGRVIRFARDL
ncbi:LexA family transcriptional regulator [Sphingomonas citricola]|uniref:LexA family transcriptional regulator n=1 Tax=Sphingomonas citricola TaxID=2862498 RepID=UPI001CA487A9|nr:S24 family peptidase [Sphingomonas citricola]